MARPVLIAALLAVVAALAACGGDDGPTYKGDPKCFAKDAKDNTCTSSEGVIYRVVDRNSVGALGKLRVRLAQGPLPAGPTRVALTVQLTPKGPYDGDISLQKANGRLFAPKTQVRKGDRLAITWVVPAGRREEALRLPGLHHVLPGARRLPRRQGAVLHLLPALEIAEAAALAYAGSREKGG